MIAPLTSSIKVDVSRLQRRKLVDFNANPRQRAAASRILRHEARNFVGICQSIAEAEFRTDRPQKRRRSKGPHYKDSFFYTPATQDSIGRMRVGFGNRHPAANIIEGGSQPHSIPSSGETYLRFPFKPGAARSRLGGPPGDWPTDFRQGGKVYSQVGSVHHPGTPAFRIIRRARERYRARARR